jgi:hypothetical protein
MRILKEGEKSKAFCPRCEAIKTITYIYRDFILDSGRKVPNVLQGVCQSCDSAISIPAQSTPKIQEAIQEKSTSLEVRVPLVLEDVLYTIGHASHLEATMALKCIIQFYSNKITLDHDTKIENYIVEIKNNHPTWFGTKRSRLSLKISFAFSEKIRVISQKLSLNKSEYIMGILVKAKEDLVEKKNGKDAKKFFESVQIIQDAI